MNCPTCHKPMELVAVANPDHPRAKHGKRELWYCRACDTTHLGVYVAADPPKSKPPADPWYDR